MGTKLLACLCTIDNQGTYTSTLCLYPKSREPVYFSLVSLSVWDCVCGACIQCGGSGGGGGIMCLCVLQLLLAPLQTLPLHVPVVMGGGLGAGRLTPHS